MLEFKIPEIGENIETGTIISISVAVGDAVKKDQDLIELETEKATVPIPSPSDGTINEILVKENDEVKIGQVIMKIAAGDEAPATKPAEEEVKEVPPTEEKETVPAADKEIETKPKEQPAAVTAPAEEEVKEAPPTEEKETVPAADKEIETEPKEQPAAVTSIPSEQIPAQGDVPAAPSVRRFAREIGIVISQVPGSGPGGRISDEDVKAYAKQLLTGMATTPTATGVVAKPLPDFSKWGKIERKPMSNIRKKTAAHLAQCWSTIPHVTQFDKADITELDKLRKKYSTPERKLTVTPFIMNVLASALEEFPKFNTSVDAANNEIIYKTSIHIGVAVDTDRGLIVPIIRDVDQKSIFELTDELNAAAERARTRKTSLDELYGGSMTLTNLGGIGGTAFAPIVNWPEVAILGIARAEWRPKYEDGKFTPRFMLPLSLSYDHRIIDGADGARFLRWVVEAIQNPFTMDLK